MIFIIHIYITKWFDNIVNFARKTLTILTQTVKGVYYAPRKEHSICLTYGALPMNPVLKSKKEMVTCKNIRWNNEF